MKSLVIYDSQYGNPEKIARAIHEQLAARRIAQSLRRAGCTIPTEPESFFITMDQPRPSRSAGTTWKSWRPASCSAP
ncbi:MAG: hypothetical protein P8Y02_15160, partial [Deinococcales bacterium]